MRHLKSLLILCLCLTMLATSVTTAFAGGQMAFGQTMQICSEGEPASITLDAHGNPVSTAHTCPDCLAVTAGMPPARLNVALLLGDWTLSFIQNRVSLASQNSPHAFARGPPALI